MQPFRVALQPFRVALQPFRVALQPFRVAKTSFRLALPSSRPALTSFRFALSPFCATQTCFHAVKSSCNAAETFRRGDQKPLRVPSTPLRHLRSLTLKQPPETSRPKPLIGISSLQLSGFLDAPNGFPSREHRHFSLSAPAALV